jgi:hypothetical protein
MIEGDSDCMDAGVFKNIFCGILASTCGNFGYVGAYGLLRNSSLVFDFILLRLIPGYLVCLAYSDSA